MTSTVTSDEPAPGGGRRRVAILSNYRTRNLGNLALSATMQGVLEERYGADRVTPCHRAPHPVVDLVTRAPVDRWPDRLRSRLGPLPSLGRPHDIPALGLTSGLPPRETESRTPPPWRRAASWLGHTRAGLELRARQRLDEARRHYDAVLSGDDVVWVPGGEIFSGGHPRNRLLDVSLALDAGRAVAMADFSFEPSPDTLEVFRSFARRLDLLVVRDAASVDRLTDAGVPTDAIVQVPDAVFLVRPPEEDDDSVATEPDRSDTVGVVLHGIAALDDGRWASLVRTLSAEGLRVEILSSHKEHDGAVIASLLDALPSGSVDVAEEFTDVGRYLRHLTTLRGVVTARFHSAVMAIACGLRVAGVDTYGTKVAGGLTEAGFGRHATGGPGWVEAAADLVVAGDPASAAVLEQARGRIRDAYARLLPLRSSPSV